MKVPEFIYGNIAPCYTCFNEDESFDPDGQRNLFDFMLQSGEVHTYFVRAGMGQMYTYEYEDVRAVAKTAIEHLTGKAPVIMNCSGIWDGDRSADHRPDPEVYTQQAVELSQYAEGLGADGVVLTIPEALAAPDGVDKDDAYSRYFETVCQAVSVPVVAYQPPIPTEVQVTPELLARLADLPNLFGIKISTKDGYYIYTMIRAAAGKEFHVITGAEMLYYATLYAGSRAVIGQGCNLYPKILNAVLHRFEAGDHDGVLEAQDSTDLLVAKCPYSAGVMKRMATESGFPVGPTARGMKNHPYGRSRVPFNDETYTAYKTLLEAELAKY